MKILFICGENKLRSPTAEAIFSGYEDLEVKSAGLNNNSEIKLSAEDIEWAEVIFVMEGKYKKKVQNQFKKYLKGQRLISLDIPDKFKFMDEELVKILKDRVEPYL
ncbi:MAG: phosphotyrosine protein phosphatase [Candidatus Omnitrophica bacterium]|nr:phosphotyrosine protein phosphatase [Candidatus Omnitrophota bacterium]